MQYCEHLTQVGLEEKEKRELELKAFHTSHTEACTTNQQLSVKRVKEFEATKEKVLQHLPIDSIHNMPLLWSVLSGPVAFLQLLRSGGPQLESSAHQEMEAAIGDLQHNLMKLEMQLVEQLEVNMS